VFERAVARIEWRGEGSEGEGTQIRGIGRAGGVDDQCEMGVAARSELGVDWMAHTRVIAK